MKKKTHSCKVSLPKDKPNPYGRDLTTAEAAREISKLGVKVKPYKLRCWRMDQSHPLKFYKMHPSHQGHCRYTWEAVQEFVTLLREGKAFAV